MGCFQKLRIGANNRIKKRRFKRVRTDYLRLLSDLLEKGLALNEATGFCCEIDCRFAPFFREMESRMAKQASWPEVFACFRLSEVQQTQLAFAFYHGNLSYVLKALAQQLEDQQKRRRDVGKALSYPGFLLAMTGVLGLLMRSILLPQLKQNRLGGSMAATSTGRWEITVVICLLLVIGCFLVYRRIKKWSYLERISRGANLPFFGHFFQLYYTSVFAGEWGQLLCLGFDARAIVEGLTQQKGNRFFREFAQAIALRFQNGFSVASSIGEWPFLMPEFTALVRRGEKNSRLGSELSVYSRRCWRQLLDQIDKGITFIQPLCFLVIACVMLRLYANMLLPIYQQMEGLL